VSSGRAAPGFAGAAGFGAEGFGGTARATGAIPEV
jgi:hypothetical protein